MSPSQKKRLILVGLVLAGVALATFFAIMSMQSSFEYFKTPTQINTEGFEAERNYRVAGLVREGTVSRLEDGVTQRFDVTDCEQDVTIQYTGILPDLFREGQAIVTVGKFTELNNKPMLVADQVLAKHDENYVPSEAADAEMLKQADKCNDVEGQATY